jgi:hypothetical protein
MNLEKIQQEINAKVQGISAKINKLDNVKYRTIRNYLKPIMDKYSKKYPYLLMIIEIHGYTNMDEKTHFQYGIKIIGEIKSPDDQQSVLNLLKQKISCDNNL